MSPDRHGVRGTRHPLPHLGAARRLGRHEPGPRLLGGLCGAAHRRRRRRDTASASPSGAATTSPPPPSRRCARTSSGGPAPRHAADLGALSTATHPRLATALARPGEGRDAHGGGRRDQRRLGPRGHDARPSRSGSSSPAMTPGGARLAGRLPLPDRRPHPRRGAGHPARRGAGPRRAGRPAAGRGLPRVHHVARLARLLRRASWSRLAEEAVADGFGQIKLKVGGDLDDDVRRMKLARAAVGPGIRIAVDANQRWDVAEAMRWMAALAPYDPHWIEEPTSPDDILGARGRPGRASR